MSKIGKSKYIAFIVLLVIALASVVIALTGCSGLLESLTGDSSDGSGSSGTTECTHTHTVSTSTATCTEGGILTVYCTDCNTVISTKEVAATGHDYEGVVTEATCTEQGYTTYTCANCGDHYVADYVNVGTHTYLAEVTAATCTTQGYTTYTCIYCEHSYVSNYVEATGHSWNTTAACEDRYCTHEGCTATQAATATHSYVLTNNTATCEENGIATYTCSLCGTAQYTQTSLAKGHTFLTDEDGEIIYDDTADAAVLKDSKTCTYTHTHTAYCTTCKEDVVISYEAVEHNYVYTTITSATCTQSGTKGMVCTECDDVLSSSIVTYTAEHTYGEGTTVSGNTVYTCLNCSKTKTVYNSTAATVDTTALASDVQLSSGTVISMSEEAVSSIGTTSELTLSATSASISDLNLSGAAATAEIVESAVYSITLTDSDNKNITQFSGTITVKLPYTLAQGEDESSIVVYYIDDNGNLEAINAVYTEGYVVFETNHFSYYSVGKYSTADLCERYGHNVKVMSKEATCTEAGYHIEICTRCNETITNEKYAALGHDFESEVTKAATCTENGTVKYTCTHCGASYTGVVKATGHNWVLDEESSVAATCSAAGYNVYVCTGCGSSYTVDLVQLSHSYTATKVVEPTCTTAGYTTYTCSSCGDSYNADYVAATGHSWNSDAACVERYCTVCGTTIPATAEHTYVEGSTACIVCGTCNHNYVETVVAPTCTAQGYTLHVCSGCGDSYITDYVAATGHKFVDGVCVNCGLKCEHNFKDGVCTICGYECEHNYVNGVCTICGYGCDHKYTAEVTEPTCTTGGYTTYTCSICGNSYKDDETEAIGHNYIAVVTKPTCTTDGYTTYTCANCGDSYVSDKVAATGHSYTAVITKPTCTEQGYTTYTCSACGYSYVSDYVDATGHNYVDGVCTVCEYKCEHDYTAVVTEPTCTKGGYTTYTCEICGYSYVGNKTAATGHNYVDGVCTVCGAKEGDADIVNIFNSIIENCYSYDYTLTLTGASLTVTQTEDETSETMSYTVDDLILYLSYTDGKLIIYGNGIVTVTYYDGDTYKSTADIYGDGEYLYLYSETDGEEYLQRLSYAYVLGDYAYILDDIEGTASSYLTQLETMLQKMLGEDLYSNWLTVLTNNSDAANELAAQIFFELFSYEEANGGYTFTLNTNYLAELVENLKTLTVAELVDNYLGEGTYTALSTYIAGLENKTLYGVVTEILEYSDDFGVDSELVFTTIDTVVYAYTGEEFSIESFLYDDSEEAQVIGEMTIAELLNAYVGLEDYSYITEALTTYGKLNIYDTLVNMMGEEMVDMVCNMATSLADGATISFTTDYEYAVTDVNFVLADVGYTQYVYSGVDYGVYDEDSTISGGDSSATEYTVAYSITITVNGTLSALYSCDIPEDCGYYKNEIETNYSAVIAAIKAACEASETRTVVINGYTFGVNGDGAVYVAFDYVNYDSLYEAVESATEEALDELVCKALSEAGITTDSEKYNTCYDEYYWGVYYPKYYDTLWSAAYEDLYSGYTYSLIFNDITEADYLAVTKDCLNSYCVDIEGSVNGCSFYAYFYINTKTLETGYWSYHSYVKIDAPEGVPTTAEKVSCGEYYYTYYECKYCGDVYIETNYKGHDIEYTYTLLEGSETCEDGVLVQGVCKVCNEVICDYTTYWHETYQVELFTLECNSDTVNGTVTYYLWTCACGYYCDLQYYSDGDGCVFKEYSSEVPVYGDDGTEIGVTYIYYCYHDGCKNYYTQTVYNCTETYGGDVYTYYQYNGDGTYTSYSYTINEVENHYIEPVYTLINGEGSSCEDGVLVELKCKYCGEVIDSYITYGHINSEEKELFTLYCNSSTENGYVTYYMVSCLCGESCSVYSKGDDYGCAFKEYSSVETVYDTDKETVIGYTYTYNCCYDGCKNYYTRTEYYCSAVYGGTLYTYYQYNEDGTYTTCGPYVMPSSHHDTSYNSDSYTDDNGNTVYRNGEYCDFCDYGYTRTYIYNTNGDLIYEGYERTDSEGKVTDSWYYLYTYSYTYDKDGDIVEVDCVKTDYYENGVFQCSYVETTSYDEVTGITTNSRKYTYNDGSTSEELRKYAYDSYGREIYYYYAEIEDGKVTYYYTYTYEFDSNNPCYALYTYSNSKGTCESQEIYDHVGGRVYFSSGDSNTCTQTYTWGYKCSECGEVIYQYTTVNGHDWYYDDDLGYYVCSRCGLESEQGSSSEIMLEDLTNNATYGKDGYVTIGYYHKYDSDFVVISYSLVPVNSQSDLSLNAGYDITSAVEALENFTNSGTYLAIPLDDLKTIAESYGISLTEYDLRVQFNYTDVDSGTVYEVTSMTITDLLLKEQIIFAIAAACNEDGTYTIDFITLQVNSDGSVSVIYEYGSDDSITLSDIGDYMTYERDCANTYHIIVDYENPDTEAYLAAFHVEFYVNIERNKISTSSSHYYEVVDSTYDTTSCGGYYYVYYACSNCGDSYYECYYKEHNWATKYELMDGSESCTDGVIVKSYCTICGEVGSEWISYNHYYNVYEYEVTCNSNGGATYITYTTCICGEITMVVIDHDDGCNFSSESVELYDGTTLIGYKHIYSCTNEGCGNYYIEYGYFCTTTYGNNHYDFYRYNSDTQEAELVCKCELANEAHELSPYSGTSDPDEDGNTVTVTGGICSHCGYSELTTTTCDSLGRIIKRYYAETPSGSEATYWWLEEFTYYGNTNNITERTYTNSYGADERYTKEYTYNEDGKLISCNYTSYYYGSVSVTWTETYTYDDSDRLIKSYYVNSDGSSRIKEYTYDESGNLSGFSYTDYYANGNVEYVLTEEYTYNDSNVNTKWYSYYKYYESDGTIYYYGNETECFDDFGRIISCYSEVYDIYEGIMSWSSEEYTYADDTDLDFSNCTRNEGSKDLN